MTFRFRRTFRIAPGLRLNVGKRGASVRAGRRGAGVTAGTRGASLGLGIPGTGLHYARKLGRRRGGRGGRRKSPGLYFWVAVIAAVAYAASRFL